MDGTVSGWEEAKINSSNPLRYDRQSGEFTVTRAGLYYLYSQVSPTWLRGGKWEPGDKGPGHGAGGQLQVGGELGLWAGVGGGGSLGHRGQGTRRPYASCLPVGAL